MSTSRLRTTAVASTAMLAVVGLLGACGGGGAAQTAKSGGQPVFGGSPGRS